MVVSLSLLFELLTVLFCIHYLYGEKLRFDRLTIGFIVVYMVLMFSINYWNVNNILTLAMYPIVMIYCGLRFGYDIKSILVNNVLWIVIVCILQATLLLLLRVFFNISNAGTDVILFINFLVFIIVALGLRKCKLEKLSKVLLSKDKLVIASRLVVIIGFSFVLLTYKRGTGFDLLNYIVFLVSIILISLATVDIGKHKIKVHEAEAELRLHKLYEASFQNLIDDICARQHEFDNHINVIYNQHLLYKNYEELIEAQRQYCQVIMQENHYNKLLSKGNPIILCFLYGKFVEAEKQGINITYKVSINDLECKVPVYKIVELLGNLIKNAVEALLEADDKRGLHVEVIETPDIIKIKVGNEVETINYSEISNFFKKGYSKKGKGRGYGLYNVKKICDDYEIELQCVDKHEEREWLFFVLEINKSH